MTGKPATPTQRIERLEREVDGYRLLLKVGLALLALATIGSFAGIVANIRLGGAQDDIREGQRGLADAVRQIQKSRVFLTARSCRQRNSERAITRANLRQNKANLAQIPDAGLAQLGFTREEAVAQIDKQIRQVAPLDCKKLVKQVAGRKVGPGGGSGSPQGARRPQASRGPSKDAQHGNGSPGAPEPGGPSEPRTPPQQPPPGNSVPPSGNGPGPSGPDPSVRPPAVTVPDVRELPRQVAPQLCQIDTPLGPILKICP